MGPWSPEPQEWLGLSRLVFFWLIFFCHDALLASDSVKGAMLRVQKRWPEGKIKKRVLNIESFFSLSN